MYTINNNTICNWCNNPATINRVHGHGQCPVCGINIDECCRGEVCEFPPASESQKSETKYDK